MKPERNFIAERPVARHCRELLPAEPEADDGPDSLQTYGERLAEALAAGLARLAGGERPEARCSPPRADSLREIIRPAPRLTAWSLLDAGRPGAWVLASIDGAAIFQLVDRAFGGTGVLPDALPEAFPLSADLFIARIEDTIAAALGEAVNGLHKPDIRRAARESDPARLTGLAGGEAVDVLDLEIRQDDRPAWKLMLAMPRAARDLLAGNAAAPVAASASRRQPANPANEPFGSLPLCVSAVLVDMRIGFSRLSGLRPGDVLPVAVARKVPLRIGERTIAQGTIGEMDDRVAVRVTQAF